MSEEIYVDNYCFQPIHPLSCNEVPAIVPSPALFVVHFLLWGWTKLHAAYRGHLCTVRLMPNTSTLTHAHTYAHTRTHIIPLKLFCLSISFCLSAQRSVSLSVCLRVCVCLSLSFIHPYTQEWWRELDMHIHRHACGTFANVPRHMIRQRQCRK